MKKNIILMFMLLGALVWTGCQQMEEQVVDIRAEKPSPKGDWKIKIAATMDNGSQGNDPATKALRMTNDATYGDGIESYWKTGENVAVYLGGAALGSLAVTVDSENEKNATLESQTLPDDFQTVEAGNTLMLLYPRATWSYEDQDGAAPAGDTPTNIAQKYNYAAAEVQVATVDKSQKEITISGSSATFTNQQSIYRFGFKAGSASGSDVNVAKFTLSSNQNKLVQKRTYDNVNKEWASTYGSLVVTPSAATTGLLYVSVRNENTNTLDRFGFTVVDDQGATYMGYKDIPADKLGDSKFVSAQKVVVNPIVMTPQSTTTATTVL